MLSHILAEGQSATVRSTPLCAVTEGEGSNVHVNFQLIPTLSRVRVDESGTPREALVMVGVGSVGGNSYLHWLAEGEEQQLQSSRPIKTLLMLKVGTGLV